MIKIKKSDLSAKIRPFDKQVLECPDETPIPLSAFIGCWVGPRGAGKSTLLCSLLDTHVDEGGLRKRFHTIFAISPTMSHDKKFKKLYDELKQDGLHYEDATEANFQEILDKLKELRDEHPKKQFLLILDDVVDKLKKSHSNTLLNHLVLAGRHYGLSMIILSQKFNAIPTLIRNNTEMWCIFSLKNRKEYQSFLDDMNYPQNVLDRIYTQAIGDGGSSEFLTINSCNCKMRFFKKFDPLLLGDSSPSSP